MSNLTDFDSICSCQGKGFGLVQSTIGGLQSTMNGWICTGSFRLGVSFKP